MAEERLPVPARKLFEELKQRNKHGAEYWTARDLQPHLGYVHWRSFENAIRKAMTSCEQSGNDPAHHFARAQTDRRRQRGRAGSR
jgi:DNA-damage-inducible protein D